MSVVGGSTTILSQGGSLVTSVVGGTTVTSVQGGSTRSIPVSRAVTRGGSAATSTGAASRSNVPAGVEFLGNAAIIAAGMLGSIFVGQIV